MHMSCSPVLVTKKWKRPKIQKAFLLFSFSFYECRIQAEYNNVKKKSVGQISFSKFGPKTGTPWTRFVCTLWHKCICYQNKTAAVGFVKVILNQVSDITFFHNNFKNIQLKIWKMKPITFCDIETKRLTKHFFSYHSLYNFAGIVLCRYSYLCDI